jgi:hypothetical protein
MKTMLKFSVISALVVWGVLAFQWNIIDAVTVFLAAPLLGMVWLLAIASVVVTLVHAILRRKDGVSALAPMLVSTVALLGAWFVPFTELWLYANFHTKKAAREQVVARIKSGALAPNVDYNGKLIVLPRGSGLSIGGDEIVVEGTSRNPYVFFLTFRGILDNYSGFLWVPDGGQPEQFGDASEPHTQIKSFGDHWYFIAHQ